MISNDNIVDIFLFDPNLDLFRTLSLCKRESVLKRMTLSKIMLHSWKQDMLKIRAIDIVDQAILDKDKDTVLSVISELKNVDSFYKIIDYCLCNTHSDFFHTIASSFLKLDYGCSYIEYYAIRKGYKDLIDDESPHHSFMQSIAQNAAEGGQIEVVREYSRGVRNFSKVAISAAKGGHLNIVKEMIKLMIDRTIKIAFDDIAASAAKGGHFHIVKHISKSISNWNSLAVSAYDHGNKEIVSYCIKKGATLCKMTEYGVVKNCHTTEWNCIAVAAAKDGDMALVKLAIENGANNNTIAVNAAENGHLDILKLALSGEWIDKDKLALLAAENNHENVVKYLIEQGARNYFRIAKKIAYYGDKEFILYLYNMSKDKLITSLEKRSLSINEYYKNLIKIDELDFGIHIDCDKYFNVNVYNPDDYLS